MKPQIPSQALGFGVNRKKSSQDLGQFPGSQRELIFPKAWSFLNNPSLSG